MLNLIDLQTELSGLEIYRSLVESLESIVASLDEMGVYHYINQLGAANHGLLPEAMIGKNLREFFSAEEAELHLARVRQVIQEKKGMVMETSSMIAGELRWFRTSIQPLPSASGAITLAMVHASDITDLKLAESRLEDRVRERTSEIGAIQQRLELATRATGLGIWEWDFSSGCITWSDLVYQIYGLAPGSFDGTIETFIKLIHPEDVPGLLAAFQTNPRDIKLNSIVYRTLHPNGSIHLIKACGTATVGQNGETIGLVGTIEDITQEKQAEQALRDREEQNRLLFEESPDPAVLTDAEGRFIRVNRAYEDLTGFPRQDLIGRTADELGLISLDTREKIRSLLIQSLENSEPYCVTEYPLKSINGKTLFLEARFYGMFVQGELHVMAAMRDITTRKQGEELLRHSEEALRQANQELASAMRMKDEFLASMSHELRTPLTGILGLAEALQYQTYGELNPKQTNALKNIEKSGQHLLALINDILDISKIGAGKLELQMEPCSLGEICQSSLLLIKSMANKKGHKVEFTMNPDSIAMMGDILRTKQILVNLLSNAVKFTPENGRIGLEVTGFQDEQLLQLVVWDSGMGISTKDLKKLFQPFTQLDGGLTRQYTGTGLGLFLAQRLVDLHGGSIQVESIEGVGSRFIVILPWLPLPGKSQGKKPMEELLDALERARQAESLAKAIHTAPPLQSQPVILVVDDNEISRETIVDYLVGRDFSVEGVSSGIEFLEVVEKVQPYLVLMDIQMPGMDGIETIQHLRAHGNAATAATPVIAVTALAMPGDRERILAAGADEYISKPISLQDLESLVRMLLVEVRSSGI